MEVHTILTPAEIAELPDRDLADTVCVVFDVLRATSTIVAALAHGARRVFAVQNIEEALALRRTRWPEALLGGERQGLRIEGFDLGNSPREYQADLVGGRDVITTTTNGTVALVACQHSASVLAAALVNLGATADWLRERQPAKVLLVCAGTGRDFAWEDGLAAGALAARLGESALDPADDATRAMLDLYALHRKDLGGALRLSQNGRRLAAIGLAEDVAWCARDSVLEEVALLEGGAIRSARKVLGSHLS